MFKNFFFSSFSSSSILNFRIRLISPSGLVLLLILSLSLNFPKNCQSQQQSSSTSQTITTSLVAKWNSTSLLSEAGEFLSSLDSSSLISSVLYWKFVDNLLDSPVSIIPPQITTFDGKVNINCD